jgi:hypothetical protein
MAVSTKDLLKSNLYTDCILNCICSDETKTIKSHRIVLATLEYFSALFRNTKLSHIIEDNLFYYVIDITVPIKSSTFDIIINQIYDRSDLQNKEIVDITDIINGLYFLGADMAIIYKYFSQFIRQITDTPNYDDKFNMIKEFCDICSLSKEIKRNFIARFFHYLNQEDAKSFRQEYQDIFPKTYYHGISSNSGNEITISNHAMTWKYSEYIYNNLEFNSYMTRANYDSGDHTGFWITCKPFGEVITGGVIQKQGIIDIEPIKAETILRIYDGIGIYEEIITAKTDRYDRNNTTMIFPNKLIDYKNKRDRYGMIFEYTQFQNDAVYEFIITLL